MSSFVKDLMRVALSNGIIIISGIATSVVTARSIGPEGNGIIAGLAVYPSLFMTIGSLGIRQATAYYLGKEIYSEAQIKTAITQIWILSTIVSVLTSFFLIVYFSNSGHNRIWAVLAVVPITFNLFITYNSGVFLGKNDLKTFNRVNWIPPLIIFVLTFTLVFYFKLGVTGALISVVGGPLFMSIVMLFKNEFLKAFSLKIDLKVIRSMLSLGLIYALALLVINLNYKIDYILLDKLSNAYELGIFSKGAGIIQYLWQIPMVLSTIVFARSAVAKNDRAFSLKVSQLLRISFILIGLASFLLFLFSNFIIVGMYGRDFQASTGVLQFLLPGVVILTIFKVMNMDLAGKGKPWVSMKAMVPSLIVNVILNFLLIPKLGAIGSSISSTVAYSVSGLLFLHFYSREVNIPIKEILKFRISDLEPIKHLFKNFKKN